MNKIYKVVWCHVRQTYVVASELASRKKMTGKSSSVTKALAIGALAVATLGGVSEAARVGDDVLQFKMDEDRYLVAYWNSILKDNWEAPSNVILPKNNTDHK